MKIRNITEVAADVFLLGLYFVVMVMWSAPYWAAFLGALGVRALQKIAEALENNQ